MVIASSATNAASNEIVTDHGPDVAELPPPVTGPPVEGARPTIMTDKVKRTLYDPEGEVEGAVMQDGAILRLEPQTTNRAESLLTQGQSVTVEGWTLKTPFGLVLAAEHVNPAVAGRK